MIGLQQFFMQLAVENPELSFENTEDYTEDYLLPASSLYFLVR